MCTPSEIIQITANMSTSLAVVVALVVFIVEIRRHRKAREYESFLALLGNYQQIVEERKNQWKKIKEALKGNPKVSSEIHDKQNSLSYLLIRLGQFEPMYAIEHGLLDRELRSLNFLDKLCELALKNDRSFEILLLTDAHEIFYYQKRLKDLLRLYESQKSIRFFPKPRYNRLIKTDTNDFFGQET